ncbi:MAG: hypothetical protein IPN75_08110 [Dechloromonas sp.]|uniref:Uncharacterized protein n=1 Tax=Candidatus Dechloromonas phosphorivorans TaxID=2899244 RepID=A0A9D7QIM6_9RHOO|nr:hypothetical protein [Candidatus Dechloromonas phosphorivorans]
MSSENREPDIPAQLARPLSEPFAFALLTWPAAAAAMHWSSADDLAWRVAALLWLALFHFAAYGRGRGAAFGNTMLLMSGVVAWAWGSFPEGSTLAAFPVLLIGLHGAQRALLRRQHAAIGTLHAAVEDAGPSA